MISATRPWWLQRAPQRIASAMLAGIGVVCLLSGGILLVISIFDAFSFGLHALAATTIASATGIAGVGIFALLFKLNGPTLIKIANVCLPLAMAAAEAWLGAKGVATIRRHYRAVAAWRQRHADGLAATLVLLAAVPLIASLIVQSQSR